MSNTFRTALGGGRQHHWAKVPTCAKLPYNYSEVLCLSSAPGGPFGGLSRLEEAVLGKAEAVCFQGDGSHPASSVPSHNNARKLEDDESSDFCKRSARSQQTYEPRRFFEERTCTTLSQNVLLDLPICRLWPLSKCIIWRWSNPPDVLRYFGSCELSSQPRSHLPCPRIARRT